MSGKPADPQGSAEEWRLTLVVRGLVGWLRRAAAALRVLAAAGRLAAGLPVLPVQRHLEAEQN